jgi:hypothetical protein
MPRYMLVANQTLGSGALSETVRGRLRSPAGARREYGPAEFHLIVPATALADQHDPDEHDAVVIAERRLQVALNHFRSVAEKAPVTGEVGHEDPMRAIENALAQQEYDEIIISTLPAGLSKWLHMDLARKAARKFDVPVTSVESVQPLSVGQSPSSSS